MNKTTKEFLLKLAELLHDYKVGMEVAETNNNGYTEYVVDGLEFTIPYVTDDGFPLDDVVQLRGRCYNSTDVFDCVQKNTP